MTRVASKKVVTICQGGLQVFKHTSYKHILMDGWLLGGRTDGRTDNQTRLQVWQVHHGYKGLPMVLVFADDDPLETGNVFFVAKNDKIT